MLFFFAARSMALRFWRGSIEGGRGGGDIRAREEDDRWRVGGSVLLRITEEGRRAIEEAGREGELSEVWDVVRERPPGVFGVEGRRTAWRLSQRKADMINSQLTHERARSVLFLLRSQLCTLVQTRSNRWLVDARNRNRFPSLVPWHTLEYRLALLAGKAILLVLVGLG